MTKTITLRLREKGYGTFRKAAEEDNRDMPCKIGSSILICKIR